MGETTRPTFDVDRAHRKRSRGLGANQAGWAAKFQDVIGESGTSFVRLAPERLRALGPSCEPSP